MNNLIKCPKCGESFEPTEAYKHELEEKLLSEVQDNHNQEIRKLKEEHAKLEEKRIKELEEVKMQIAESAKKEAEEKVRNELESKILTTKEESAAREKKNEELQEELKETLKQMRELKDEKDKIEIQAQKKLLEEQDKIKKAAKEEAHKELDMKIAEKDKKLNDALKVNEDLRRKLEQGSQQLQGEIQELALEEILKENFPFDDIREVPKGIRGADAIQLVNSSGGVGCGTILWESKRTKNWSAEWTSKLREDQRALKAKIAVIVTETMPEGISNFGMIDGVYVVDFNTVTSLTHILRDQLIKLHSAHIANDNKSTKAEIVYNYLISNEFKQRIEVWVDFFRNRREDINKERNYFNKKWEREEKEIVKVMNATSGMYGDLQGLIGNALPKVNYLELPEAEELEE